ncbi:hypothetical protein GCM10010269_60350 [Streptomyces humidus]|uniref:Secreted protein n=1 Tax=Streptomyces humidus TaxID=52259 RepID=A0A918G1V8_9ACTN|nr:hypothetical protein [Streptomyces humidus]GGS12999.1 hypothetical protein GCM10010269_60350 [Streptomyces humidus]
MIKKPSSRKRHVLGTVLAAVGLAGTALVVTAPTASAGSTGTLACNQNWSISSAQGYANGQWCDGNTRVTGTVHDTKADGRCPFVRGYLSGGGYHDSAWAGPKGDSSPVNLSAPSGRTFTSVAMNYITC